MYAPLVSRAVPMSPWCSNDTHAAARALQASSLSCLQVGLTPDIACRPLEGAFEAWHTGAPSQAELLQDKCLQQALSSVQVAPSLLASN